MATADGTDIFECSVCYNEMLDRNPRSLYCLHSFCEPCLEKLVNRGTITCPSCRNVSKVQDNNVKNLPVNFMLNQMRNYVMRKDSSKEESKCAMCKNEFPAFKCVSCDKVICRKCKEEHIEIHKFKGHDVFDICKMHQEIITHMCAQCRIHLCAICMLVEHKNHNRYFEDLQNTNDTLKQKASSTREIIDIIKKQLNRKLLNQKSKKDENLNRKHELFETLMYHQQKVIETEELIEIIDNDNLELETHQEKYENAITECESLVLELDNLVSADFYIKYLDVMRKSAEFIDKIQMLDSGIRTSMHCAGPSQSKQVIQSILKEKHINNMTKLGDMRYMRQMASLGDEVLGIPSTAHGLVLVKLNLDGEVTTHHYPAMKDAYILSVCVYKNSIYMLHLNTITVMSSRTQQQKLYKPKIDNMYRVYRMLVIAEDQLLICTNEKSSCIYHYNISSDHTKIVLEGLVNIEHINMTDTENGVRYIVSESGAHCVRVYTDTWELLNTIGVPGKRGLSDGLLNYPCGIAVTDQKTILVADFRNHRVTHFTLGGQFLSHVLTQSDGIECPEGLLYKNNVLWLCTVQGTVECFKLRYTMETFTGKESRAFCNIC